MAVDIADLYARHRRIVFNIARDLLRHREDAEDVTQEAFLRLCSAHLDHPQHVRRWLARVTKNLCADLYRRRQGSIACEPATMDDPVRIMLRRAASGRLLELVDGLPDHQHDVIEMYYFQNMNEADIAADLGIDPDTVGTRLWRARQRLRRGLADWI